MSECGGSLKRIFVSLVTGGRDESDDVDEEKSTNDAKAGPAASPLKEKK